MRRAIETVTLPGDRETYLAYRYRRATARDDRLSREEWRAAACVAQRIVFGQPGCLCTLCPPSGGEWEGYY